MPQKNKFWQKKTKNSIALPKEYKYKQIYYESKLRKNVPNMKLTWTTMKEMPNKCNSHFFPAYFVIIGDKIDNKEDNTNNFNSFYHNISPNTLRTFLNTKTNV